MDHLFDTNKPGVRMTSKTITSKLLFISFLAFLEFFFKAAFPSEIYFGVVFCKFLQ